MIDAKGKEITIEEIEEGIKFKYFMMEQLLRVILPRSMAAIKWFYQNEN